MIDGIKLKICGLRTLRDAAMAESCGADFLGFIFYPPSPRALTLEGYRAFSGKLSISRKVAVTVEPSAADLAKLTEAGFDYFQVHFRPEFPLSTVADWSKLVGADRLWLVPKLPPGVGLPPALIPLAETFLLDTFDPDKFGGTGRTGDWTRLIRYQQAHPEKTWILSGGLNSGNIAEAMRVSGTKVVDVNSGVESAPGVKDHFKLAELVEAMVRRSPG